MKIAFAGKGGSGILLAVTGPFGADDLGVARYHSKVSAAERLEPENRLALRDMQALVDRTTQDWARFQRDAVRFHLRNARAGRDLAEQVDPGFVPGPLSVH